MSSTPRGMSLFNCLALSYIPHPKPSKYGLKFGGH